MTSSITGAISERVAAYFICCSLSGGSPASTLLLPFFGKQFMEHLTLGFVRSPLKQQAIVLDVFSSDEAGLWAIYD